MDALLCGNRGKKSLKNPSDTGHIHDIMGIVIKKKGGKEEREKGKRLQHRRHTDQIGPVIQQPNSWKTATNHISGSKGQKHDVCKLFPEKKNRFHVLYHMYISLIAEASHLAR